MSSHQHRWKVDKNLIPLKAHYFLQSAGVGAIWPFLPVLGRQLGITPFNIGLIFGIATLTVIIAKPLAKRFTNQKTVFIISAFLVLVSLLSFTIFPQPNIHGTRPVEFECGRGSNYIKQCSPNLRKDASFKHDPLVCPTLEERGWIDVNNENSPAKYIPNYIENDLRRYETLLAHIRKNSSVNEIAKAKGTASSSSQSQTKTKRAAIAVEIPDTKQNNEPVPRKPNLQNANATSVNTSDQDDSSNRCYISCEAIDFHQLEHFCANFLGKKDISADLCNALSNLTAVKRAIEEETRWSSYSLYFETIIKIAKTKLVKDCIFLPIETISFKSVQRITEDEVTNARLTGNVSTIEPDQLPFEKFACLPQEAVFKNCFANCPKNSFGLHLNAYLEVYTPIEHELFSTEIRFWLYVIVASLGVVALGIVTSQNDSICSQLVYDNPDKFGLQKLWAVGGFGLFCLFSGYFIDRVSEAKIAKDYAPCFFLIAGLFTLDFVISFKLEIKPPIKYQVLWRESLGVLRDPRITLFIFDCIILGICSGIHATYLLWYIEELNEKNGCTDASDWIRTLQGCLVAVRCLSEILFFRVAGWLLNKFGYFNCTSLVLVMSAVQYAMYCLLTHPWSFVPLELFQGIIYSIFFSTMANYGNVAVSLSGRQNTPRVKQFFATAFSIIGMSTGAILGGYLFQDHGGQMMFAVVAVSCLILSFVHSGLVVVVNKKINYGHTIPTVYSTNTSANEQKLKRISRSDSQEFHFEFESDID